MLDWEIPNIYVFINNSTAEKKIDQYRTHIDYMICIKLQSCFLFVLLEGIAGREGNISDSPFDWTPLPYFSRLGKQQSTFACNSLKNKSRWISSFSCLYASIVIKLLWPKIL
jgi:hypothetical protein